MDPLNLFPLKRLRRSENNNRRGQKTQLQMKNIVKEIENKLDHENIKRFEGYEDSHPLSKKEFRKTMLKLQKANRNNHNSNVSGRRKGL